MVVPEKAYDENQKLEDEFLKKLEFSTENGIPSRYVYGVYEDKINSKDTKENKNAGKALYFSTSITYHNLIQEISARFQSLKENQIYLIKKEFNFLEAKDILHCLVHSKLINGSDAANFFDVYKDNFKKKQRKNSYTQNDIRYEKKWYEDWKTKFQEQLEEEKRLFDKGEKVLTKINSYQPLLQPKENKKYKYYLQLLFNNIPNLINKNIGINIFYNFQPNIYCPLISYVDNNGKLHIKCLKGSEKVLEKLELLMKAETLSEKNSFRIIVFLDEADPVEKGSVKGSPKGSPRGSPGGSPRGSSRGSPGGSPRGSPRGSSRGSPRGSSRGSSRGSPKSSLRDASLVKSSIDPSFTSPSPYDVNVYNNKDVGSFTYFTYFFETVPVKEEENYEIKFLIGISDSKRINTIIKNINLSWGVEKIKAVLNKKSLFSSELTYYSQKLEINFNFFPYYLFFIDEFSNFITIYEDNKPNFATEKKSLIFNYFSTYRYDKENNDTIDPILIVMPKKNTVVGENAKVANDKVANAKVANAKVANDKVANAKVANGKGEPGKDGENLVYSEYKEINYRPNLILNFDEKVNKTSVTITINNIEDEKLYSFLKNYLSRVLPLLYSGTPQNTKIENLISNCVKKDQNDNGNKKTKENLKANDELKALRNCLGEKYQNHDKRNSRSGARCTKKHYPSVINENEIEGLKKGGHDVRVYNECILACKNKDLKKMVFLNQDHNQPCCNKTGKLNNQGKNKTSSNYENTILQVIDEGRVAKVPDNLDKQITQLLRLTHSAEYQEYLSGNYEIKREGVKNDKISFIRASFRAMGKTIPKKNQKIWELLNSTIKDGTMYQERTKLSEVFKEIYFPLDFNEYFDPYKYYRAIESNLQCNIVWLNNNNILFPSNKSFYNRKFYYEKTIFLVEINVKYPNYTQYNPIFLEIKSSNKPKFVFEHEIHKYIYEIFNQKKYLNFYPTVFDLPEIQSNNIISKVNAFSYYAEIKEDLRRRELHLPLLRLLYLTHLIYQIYSHTKILL
jgi:hypothetical protein